jgi:hypothetical protein
MRLRTLGVMTGMVLFGVSAIAGLTAFAQAAPAQQLAAGSFDDAAAMIAKYGKPDIDSTDAFNAKHATVVSRDLIYKRESVHAYYLPGGVFGAHPPYGPWKVLTYQDETTHATLTPEEVDERMQDRLH